MGGCVYAESRAWQGELLLINFGWTEKMRCEWGGAGDNMATLYEADSTIWDCERI